MLALRGAVMEKGLCWAAIGVSGLLFVIFLLDLVAGIPFSSGTPADKSSPFVMVDIMGLLAAAIIAYLGYNALRDIQ